MIKFTYTLFFSLFILANARAQNDGGGVDNEHLHFGFTFQYVNAEYKVFKKLDWKSEYFKDGRLITPTRYSISSVKSPGFGLGFVSDLKVGGHGNLRFTPLLVFTDRAIEYSYNNVIDIQSKKVSATLVDFPLGFKLKSDKRGNFRAYILGGAKYSMDIISKKKTDDSDFADIDKLVKNKNSFLSYEAGIGFDLYFEYFKLSPEIKFSQSVNSVLKNDKELNAFTSPLEKLYLRNFLFSLYFE